MSIDIKDLYDEASDLYNKEKYQESFNIFLKLAKKNDVDAQDSIAEMYFDGIGVEKNTIQAILWWEKASKQGCSNALFELGKLKIINSDTKEGLKLVIQASNDFHLDAMYLMAGYYYYGKYVKKDINKAIELYEESSKRGHKKATNDYLLALFKVHGKRKAFKYIIKLLFKLESWKLT